MVFLDIEEGGRLTENYHAYLQEWVAGIAAAGLRAGVYCSGMPVKEGAGVTITTAQDILNREGNRNVAFWVYNDACPPSPGCSFEAGRVKLAQSGFTGASVWQYAQSPRRKEFTAACPANYAADGNCYAPSDEERKWFLDANVADSSDPSNGR